MNVLLLLAVSWIYSVCMVQGTVIYYPNNAVLFNKEDTGFLNKFTNNFEQLGELEFQTLLDTSTGNISFDSTKIGNVLYRKACIEKLTDKEAPSDAMCLIPSIAVYPLPKEYYLSQPIVSYTDALITRAAIKWKFGDLFVKGSQFLRAFSSSIWSVLLAVFAFAAPLMYLLEMWDAEKKSLKVKNSGLSLIDTYHMFGNSLLLQGFPKRPKSKGGIFFSLCWRFFSLVCVIYYAIGLFLTVQSELTTKTLPSASHLQCLPDAFMSPVDSNCTLISYDSLLQERKPQNQNKPDTQLPLTGDSALVVDSLTANYLINERHNEYVMLKDSVAKKTVQLVLMSKSKSMANKISKLIAEDLQSESGDYKIFCPDSDSPIGSIKFDTDNFNGLLLFIGVAAMVAVTIQISEVLWILVIKKFA